jgi:alkaline phosphatase D
MARYVNIMPWSRRSFLIAAAGLAATSFAAKPSPRLRLHGNPFTLGVSSGYPLPDGVVLWTRLAPDSLHGGGMPPAEVEVAWEVAADPHFRTIVRRGVESARPEWAHSVHAEARGLEPAHWY